MTIDDDAKVARMTQLTPPSPIDSPPRMVDVEVEFGAGTRPGPGRVAGDDHYLVLRLERHLETLLTSLSEPDRLRSPEEFGYGMVLADGIGRAGETASRAALATLVQLAVDFGKWHVRVNELIADEMMNRAERYFRSVDAALRIAGTGERTALQTALTVTYSAGAELFFAHVGHSRAYLFRDDHLLQLTHDHTVRRRRHGERIVPGVAADMPDRRDVVTGVLGASGVGLTRIDVERCGLLDGDVILLCTKGLTDVIDDAHLAEVLRAHPVPDDACAAAVHLAGRAGASDDVTAMVAHYRISAAAA